MIVLHSFYDLPFQQFEYETYVCILRLDEVGRAIFNNRLQEGQKEPIHILTVVRNSSPGTMIGLK